MENSDAPKICLNMIVKNESKVILRLLNSVLPIIDSYCICDTGSTDDTIDIIEQFMNNNNISGKIVKEPFRDFGYNRTFALNACVGLSNADYLLLMDADMILRIGEGVTKQSLSPILKGGDSFYIFQGSDSFFYKNVRLLRNNPEYSYWGVTHEYVKTTPGTVYKEIEKPILFIDDIGDGGAKHDKFERDIRLLLKGLEENPNNERYTFYLANSYSNIQNHDKAIEYYKKRIELGGWNQEVWFSYYSIGKCYKSKGDIANAIYYWLEAYQYFPSRIENLYQLMNHYRTEGKNLLAYEIFDMADYERNNNNSDDHLFLEKDIYEYKIDYEFTIIGYYRNPHNKDISKSCMKVLAHPLSSDSTNKNVLSNYKFYTTALKSLETKMSNEVISVLNTINVPIENDVYLSSTPSICMDPYYDNKLYVNTRFVSYRIDDKGDYSYDQNIKTKNVISVINIGSRKWEKEREFLLEYNTVYDGLYIGLEDVRLFYNNDLYFNANRGLGYNNMVIETGKINLVTNSTASNLVYMENQRDIEKNWVLFKNRDREVKTIYGWYPLKIGNIEEDKRIDDKNQITKKMVVTHEFDTPNFFRWVRGSTNGVTIGDEVWFICHLVSYEDRRYYYHIFVVLDSNTMEVKKYSKLFTFEKEKVEYTLGFVYFKNKNEFLIGYSLLDKETKYLTINKKEIDSLMV